MGEISYYQSLDFYNSIKMKVTAIMESPELVPSEGVTIQQIPASKWINTSQTTYLLCTMDTFIKVISNIQCENEQLIFLKWIQNGKLSNQDQESLKVWLITMTLKNTRDSVVYSMARELCKTPTFQQSPHPLELAKGLLVKLTNGNTGLLEENALFFISVLNQYITNFPTPIRTILEGLGVSIPTDISPELAFILQENMDEVPGLKDGDWPKFIYCILLFLHQCAKESPSLSVYTYAGASLSFSFESCIQHHTQRLMDSLGSRNPFYTKDIITQLQLELKEFNLASVHPKLLALLCFDQCEPLKQIFIKAWKKLQIPLSNSPVLALLPSTNKFTIGETIYNHQNNKVIPISKEDIRLVKRLKQLVLAYETKTSGNSKPFFAETIDSTHPPFRTKEEFLQEFVAISKQIMDPKLKPFLSIETIGQLHFCYALNTSAIVEFICEYLKNPEFQYPSTDDLADLYSAVKSAKTLEGIIQAAANNKLYINLDDKVTYNAQLTLIEEKIKQLSLLGTAPKANTIDSEATLRQWWVEVQLQTLMKFKEMIKANQEETQYKNTQVGLSMN
jgi:hypothetical protein